MRRDRYEICKNLIKEGKWDIDLENGIVIGKRGGRGTPDSSGYLKMSVKINGCICNFFVHEIIAIAGGLIPIDITIDHIDGNKMNNKLSNLQLLTNEDNISKTHKGKSKYKGSQSPMSKLTEGDVKEIKKMLKNKNIKQIDIAKKYNVSKETITDIKQGKTWKHV